MTHQDLDHSRERTLQARIWTLEAEIERLRAEVASKGEQIGKLYRVCNERDVLRAALKPFAEIGLDVLKEHPGWANHVFAGEWCGYRLTYMQFEAAAAAAIGAEQASGE